MPAINTTGDFYPAYRSKNPHFAVETFACAERTVSRLLDASIPAKERWQVLLRGQISSFPSKAKTLSSS